MALFDTRTKKIVSSAILLAVAIALFVMLKVRQAPRSQYITNQGNVFGTTYHIKYETFGDLEDTIKLVLKEVDNSLSMFNQSSTISKINNGETLTDTHFLTVFNKATEVYKLSEGGFDITVSPLVHAWGFGKSKDGKPSVSPEQIDSILTFVGFHKIHLNGDQLTKDDPRITLDCSAIAKGYGCDVVARALESKGVENYMVEIGGEVVCRGVNENGKPWRIGINTPKDDPEGVNHETQCVVAGNLNLATSGSYRQFNIDENGIRRSHTVDPRTGYPVSNNLLSATIIAPDCMTADALATACMVMGLEASIDAIEQLPETECFLIYDLDGEHLVRQSSGFEKYIVK